ncbi:MULTISPECIES: 16S rRNA (cytidine(1402)-2'-O)-methyltransferase [unclassified Candidatus Frackibacter]|uniref:16S rRNA (cytidine(1402)-2'-O)-methyltransferase n=1 Tax=unclassified Candidatus Frackibacter TaxID=2648818 RepID=UPI00079B110A|nr:MULTISPECIES: 16S rRNA (cytidine(1402)-2'-O)-methyltransferase [unclassified Candidatus Frackibacter]KXS45835.1 MAG: 16S rRNA (cytidine1402-2'-O)-methyltransferase [Candidatus Frackibacter sp. T328-2]SDC54551.1 16S rRNA (cytidine1402-2'-O)-methyltransferase [Candidatus Frackibacter sp. WG11]SEM66719.1 16S rRNA (cytidine1402-2'-O)-methyltransferase [Candidatus Frackibacter sp. WG12]SFL78038.1 16S rRNA (cytidine1402-2'-O)-methyltransferase [Candidatus Frackibacter sp. WG13]
MSRGNLYICGTPIGNLEDISLRTLRILKEVDYIAAEDTRRTQNLLNHYEIDTPLVSYHEHNEEEMSEKIIERLKSGEEIALVSDAGMPGISDPGYKLTSLADKEDIRVIPVPGPTAMTAALVASGLPTDKFVFEGFLPRKGKQRKDRLKELSAETRTIVFYESPYRLKDSLQNMLDILGDRKIAVWREITKKFEEKIAGKISEVLSHFETKNPKGEITIVLDGVNLKKFKQKDAAWKELSILEHVELLMDKGVTKKEAIKLVAKERDLPKSEVYEEAIAINVKKR